jgi:hypothetical protein
MLLVISHFEAQASQIVSKTSVISFPPKDILTRAAGKTTIDNCKTVNIIPFESPVKRFLLHQGGVKMGMIAPQPIRLITGDKRMEAILPEDA